MSNLRKKTPSYDEIYSYESLSDSEGPTSDEEKERENDIYPNSMMTKEEIIFNKSEQFNKDVFKIMLSLSDSLSDSLSEKCIIFKDLPKWEFYMSPNNYENLIRIWIADNFDKMKTLLDIIDNDE